jgi:hypothetical protein
MFKVSKNRIVKDWPVVIAVPQDGGRVMKHEALVDFEILTQPQQDAIYAGGGTDVDLLNRVVVGWPEGKFENDDGTALLFNERGKAMLFEISYVKQALISAYLLAFTGREGQRKN